MVLFLVSQEKLTPTADTNALSGASANDKDTRPQKPVQVTQLASPPTKAQPVQQKQPIQTEQAAKTTAQPQPKKPPEVKQTTKSTASSTEEVEVEDYNSLDNMISNNVLTWEMSNVQRKIEDFKKGNQPVPPDLVDRLQMIEARIQILVLQVQTGKITEQKYASMLKSKVSETVSPFFYLFILF